MLGLAYPHLFITLFGPRNETFIGELNMTAITLPRTDTRAASSADDVGASASSSSSSSSSSRSSYDSRGAAYYICVVILVYALAIALFIVSLARRRNAKDNKYRLAHDQNVDYQQAEERQEGCWKERCRDSSEPPRMPSSPWSSSSSSSTSSNSEVAQQRPVNLDVDPKNATATGSAQLNLDEVITLVQFLPCSISSSSKGSAASDADGGASCCGVEGVSISGQELETEQEKKRYRWSMGPDGNIWILQVEDADVIDNTENNNDKTPSNNAFNCHLKLTTHPLGPSHSFKDPPCAQSCCSSDATANVPLLSLGVKTVSKAKVEQQRPKTLPFSPVPKGYRQRRRTFNKEKKARLHSSDNQDSKTTYQERNYHCPTIGDQTTNSSSLIARKHRWEENHYREQQLGSPHFIHKLIHVTSV